MLQLLVPVTRENAPVLLNTVSLIHELLSLVTSRSPYYSTFLAFCVLVQTSRYYYMTNTFVYQSYRKPCRAGFNVVITFPVVLSKLDRDSFYEITVPNPKILILTYLALHGMRKWHGEIHEGFVSH